MKKKKRPEGNILSNILIVILSFCVIILGYFILKPTVDQWQFSSPFSPTGPAINEQLPNTSLTPPAPGDSEQKKKEFYETVVKNAVEAPYLDIKNCNNEPKIIRVRNRSRLLIKNSGPVGHYIKLIDKNYLISAGGQEEVFIEAQKVPLIYGIGCDVPGPNGGGGLILILGE